MDYLKDKIGTRIEEPGKPNGFHDYGSTAALLWLRSELSVRSNTVPNAMIVDKAFCKPMDGSLGRIITCRKDKPITRVST